MQQTDLMSNPTSWPFLIRTIYFFFFFALEDVDLPAALTQHLLLQYPNLSYYRSVIGSNDIVRRLRIPPLTTRVPGTSRCKRRQVRVSRRRVSRRIKALISDPIMYIIP